jgi:cAMP-dependent protein kinase regulator
MHMLFGLVSDSTLEKVLDAMLSKNIAVGEDVIRQGAEGDYFYIVKSGKFDILINIPGGEKKVWEAGEGFAFGELALL